MQEVHPDNACNAVALQLLQRCLLATFPLRMSCS